MRNFWVLWLLYQNLLKHWWQLFALVTEMTLFVLCLLNLNHDYTVWELRNPVSYISVFIFTWKLSYLCRHTFCQYLISQMITLLLDNDIYGTKKIGLHKFRKAGAVYFCTGCMILTLTSTPDLTALLSSSSSHPTSRNFLCASQKVK